MIDILKLSARNLKRRGKRSWLTIIGIIIGITAVVALFSLGQGLEASVTQEFEELGANAIFIIPGEGLQGFFDPEGQLETGDLEAVRNTRGVSEAGPVIFAQKPAEFRGDEQFISVIGLPTDSSQEMVMRTNSLELESGRNLRSGDRFSGLAGTDMQTGDVFEREVGLRDRVVVDGNSVRTVGLLEPTGDPVYDSAIFLPIETSREILDDRDRTDFIVAEVDSGQEPGEVANQIEESIRRDRNVAEGDEDFTVSTADDLIESLVGILSTVQYVVAGIVSIALFVGGLGIMNTMYMSVSERTKEIGVMKALGARKRQILSIYLFEAGVLGLIGGLIGVVLGMALSEVAFYFIRRTVEIPLEPARNLFLPLTALGLSFLLGMISGLLPARKAAALEPVEAIRQG